MEADQVSRVEEPAFDREKVQSKVHYYLRTCTAAVKKAKTFELQRVVKKLKTTTSGDADRSALESLLVALKASNHGRVAATAIKSKLTKAKLLPRGHVEAGNEEETKKVYPMAAMMHEVDEQSTGGDEGRQDGEKEGEKATARLLSHKVVSEEVSRAVKELSSLLEAKAVSRGGEIGSVKRKRTKKEAREKAPLKTADELVICGEESGGGGGGGGESTKVDEEKNGKEQKGEVYSPDQAEAVREKIKRLERGGNRDSGQPHKRIRIDKDGADGAEATDEEDLSDNLPALSTGFVAGRGWRLGRESDEEWSDGDAELDSIDEEADEGKRAKESKRNRMGQRARRALWEKKFGRQANHLKVREREPRKATREAAPNPKHAPRSDSGWSTAPPRSGPSQQSLSTGRGKGEAETEMHPSWIAKQRQKERAEAAARGGGTAKKIVFD